MKKSLTAYLLLMASWMPVSADNCCTPCGPLNPCEMTASIRGGVEWMYYPDCRRNNFENWTGASITTTEEVEETEVSVGTFLDLQVETGTTPKFSDQFTLPWTIVGEIGYSLSCNTEVFADFHYGKANGKSRSYVKEYDELTDPPEFLPVTPDVIVYRPAQTWDITEDYSDLNYFGGTIGFRHYFDPICGRLFPFFGVKAGVRHFDPVKAVVAATLSIPNTEEFSTQTERGLYYDSYNVLHGGFQLGFNMKCGECISFFVMVETLGTCGFKPHSTGFYFENDGESTEIDEDTTIETEYISVMNVPARSTYNILSFPVTVGVKYSF